MDPLNKTMQRSDLDRADARSIVGELDRLAALLGEHGLRASTWYGALEPDPADAWERANRGYRYRPLPGAADDARWPWFLYWEIAWLALHTSFRQDERVLDLGGSSSLFSYFLAARGLDVLAVDLDPALVENGNATAARLGWRLENRLLNIRDLELGEAFDHVTSVCVYEHVPVHDRIGVSGQVGHLLRPGGTFSLTFDFRNPSRRAALSSAADVDDQIARPSGLRVRGNAVFHDSGERYLLHPFFHPSAFPRGWKRRGIRRGEFGWLDWPRVKLRDDYTFGALFLEK